MFSLRLFAPAPSKSEEDVVSLDIEIFSECGVALVRCDGRILAGKEARLLWERLNPVFSDFSACILNLAKVVQIDAQGLGTVMDCYRKAHQSDCALILAQVPPRVQRLLDVTKLSAVLEIFPSEEAAIEACCEVA